MTRGTKTAFTIGTNKPFRSCSVPEQLLRTVLACVYIRRLPTRTNGRCSLCMRVRKPTMHSPRLLFIQSHALSTACEAVASLLTFTALSMLEEGASESAKKTAGV